jgi:hypothetical protein
MNKFNLYLELIKSQQDANGFIESHECDSLLFSSLVGCVPGVKVNIDAAMGAPGQWFRRPLALGECYSCGKSKSTISRDMLLGLAWYAYFNKRLDISEGVIKYAFTHGFVMGKGVLSRTLMTPALLATFAWVSYKLGGPSRGWLRWIPADLGAKVDGYKAHLQVLHILLRKTLSGKWSKQDQKTVGRLQLDEPLNPLFSACNASLIANEEIEEVLDCENWWPSDRLPNSQDRKAQWLPMRSYGKDWKPSPGEWKVHSGGDYLFIKWLLTALSN